jgi:hypothetical protein
VTLEDELAALDRAALLIDGEPKEYMVPLAPSEAKVAERMGSRLECVEFATS